MAAAIANAYPLVLVGVLFFLAVRLCIKDHGEDASENRDE